MKDFSREIGNSEYSSWADVHKDELLKSAVNAIEPDRMQMTRTNALTLAGAMKNCGFSRDDFAEVMARSSVDKGTFADQWDSFKGEGKRGKATEGTIFDFAQQCGWKWPKPDDGDHHDLRSTGPTRPRTNTIAADAPEDFSFRCLIDSVGYTQKPMNPGAIRSREKVPTPEPEQIRLSDFADAVSSGRTFYPTVYSKEPTGTNDKGKPIFRYRPVSQQLFVVDIDNEETALDEKGKPVVENGKQKKRRVSPPLTIDSAIAICEKHGIAPFMIYETFSSKYHRDDPSEPYAKFRLCFVLDEPLTVQEVGTRGLETVIKFFIGLFGKAADTSTTDPGRMIYGTDERDRIALFNKVIKKEKLITKVLTPTSEAQRAKGEDIIQEYGITILPANPDAVKPSTQGNDHITIGGYEDVETKPTDFLFFPWFPRGKLVAVQGDSGSSKSTFMYAVGALVTTNSDLLGSPCEDPGNVMFITIEDDPGDIKTAFLDAGGDLSKLKRITDREAIAKLTLSEDGKEEINRIIKEHGIKLLVLDPIQQFLAGDMNKANETRPQLSRLMNIAAENNICIVFIEHMGKDTSKAALHRGVGSVDIGASTRSMIQVVTDPEDDFFKIAFTVKNNTADSHDTQRAIRYQVKDHPGSYNPETKKRDRFHGHAEFISILPEYSERQYRKAMRKAEDAEAAEETLLYEYDDDPLVVTARQLIAENPQGLFIGTDDLIRKITLVCGRCPYDQTKSIITGIYARVNKLRHLMIDKDGIQLDVQSNSVWPKAYHWRGVVTEPAHTRTKGFTLTAVKARQEGYQQTRF